MTKGILRKMHKDNKGFTLIELMIVVAIIGILAAIAIPQFVQYRIRGYNASAQSDVRNLNTSQAALFADWQLYGITEQAAGATVIAALAAANGGSGPGAIASIATTGPLTIPVLTVTDASATNRALQLPIGNGVLAVATTDATSASFVALAKHTQGDSFFAVDSDSTAVYLDNSSTVAATGVSYSLAAGDEPASVPGIDDIAGTNGPSGLPWLAK